MSKDNYSLNVKVGGLPNIFLGAGVLGVVLSGIAFFQNRKDFFASYLTVFAFFLCISLGSLFFIMVNHLARSAWSVTVRRIAETSAANLPWMALLFVPLLVGMDDLLPWTNPEMRAHDHLVQIKAPYLNVPFLLIRAFLYFASWTALSWFFVSTSKKQDVTKDANLSHLMGRVAAGGAAVYALSQTFFAFDWIMSLNPHWFSTMFGVYYFAGSVVAQYCFLIIWSAYLRAKTGRKDIYRHDHFHDMGKLLFGHNVFWTYIAFGQFMLIWYANEPEETMFYHMRAVGTWKIVSLLLPWCHFAIPFLYLMSWHVKRNVKAITVGAFWLIAMCLIDIYWMIQPNFHTAGAHLGLSDLGSFLMIGGFFLYLFVNRLKGVNLIPTGDPRLQDSLNYDNGVVTHERD
jgi:hypothetical protein